MTTLREIREEHYISRRTLATAAGVSESTIVRIEEGAHHTRKDIAEKVLAALNKQIEKEITLQELEGLNLYNVMRDRRQRKKTTEDTPASEGSAA
jgi:predicted transcriptional regulator